MLRRLPDRVLRRARWATVRASWAGTRNQPPDRDERLAVARREPQQRRQVGAGPQAVHVGLAGAGLTAAEDAGEGLAVVDPDLRAALGLVAAEGLDGAVGEDDAQATDPDALGRGEGHPPGEAVEEAGRGDALDGEGGTAHRATS